MTLDRSRSTVGFSIRHMGVATVRGSFSSFAARVEPGPDGLQVRAEVDPTSVETGNGIRDGRLRSEFFAADDYPAITFEGLGELDSQVEGRLTIRGATRPVSLSVRAETLTPDTLRIRAVGRIRRSDFGLDWDALRDAGRLLVADHVRVFADVVIQRG